MSSKLTIVTWLPSVANRWDALDDDRGFNEDNDNKINDFYGVMCSCQDCHGRKSEMGHPPPRLLEARREVGAWRESSVSNIIRHDYFQ